MPVHVQESFGAGELGPKLHYRFRLNKHRVGSAKARNVFIEPSGCLSSRAGTIFSADVGTPDARLIPFKFSADEQYVLIFTNALMKVVKTGVLDYVQSGGSDYSVVSPYTTAYLRQIDYVQRNDIMYLLHPLYAVRKLSRTADDNWSFTAVSFAPGIAAPTSPSANWTASGAPDEATQDTKYKVTSISENGEESLPTAEFEDGGGSATAGKNDLSWTAESDAVRYKVYADENGLFGYIGETDQTSFTDDGYNPDTTRTPPDSRDPFGSASDYPGTGQILQQRLVLANSVNDPLGIEMSQTTAYENFTYSRPARGSDAIELEVDAAQQGEVRHILDLGGPVVMTSDEVRALKPANGNALQADDLINMPTQLRVGASAVKPLVVLDHILMIEDTGDRIQSLSYDEVFIERIQGREISILSDHFFRSKEVRQWTYARAPYSIIPTVMNDFTCVTMTYVAEHDIYGWCEWTTGLSGSFYDCCTIREGDRDVPYFLVKRTINGATKYYLEKLADREETTIADMVFVDCAATYSGASTTTPTGFDHLNGESGLVGLADGAVIDDITVSGGTFTLTKAASKVTLGTRVTARVQTLPIPPQRDPDSRSGEDVADAPLNEIVIGSVHPRVYASGPVYVATEVDANDELVDERKISPPFATTFSAGAQLQTRRLELRPAADYTEDGQYYIEHRDPLPFTLLSSSARYEYAGPDD